MYLCPQWSLPVGGFFRVWGWGEGVGGRMVLMVWASGCQQPSLLSKRVCVYVYMLLCVHVSVCVHVCACVHVGACVCSCVLHVCEITTQGSSILTNTETTNTSLQHKHYYIHTCVPIKHTAQISPYREQSTLSFLMAGPAQLHYSTTSTCHKP